MINYKKKLIFVILTNLLLLITYTKWAFSQQRRVIQLTFDKAVEIAMSNSYRVKELNMRIQRQRKLQDAERANLRSKVDMKLTIPEFQSISKQQFNSELQRNVVVHENSRMWQMNLSIEQPVILFGYPTNGYISVNNAVYRYSQLGKQKQKDVTYYNRYFIKYEQPLFQPNKLKNDLKKASLDVKEAEYEYRQDIINLLGDTADDYRGLFESAFKRIIYKNQVKNIEQALEVARSKRDENSGVDQLQVELANAQEQYKQSGSSLRTNVAQIKQRLRLSETDSVTINPIFKINPIQVNINDAIRYGLKQRPDIKRLENEKANKEIDLDQTKGENSFHVNIAATYGREMQNPGFEQLFDNPTNSYTVGINADIPIWDWGRRKYRIQAAKLDVKKSQLAIEDEKSQVRTEIRNAVQTLHDYQSRAQRMQENLELARKTTDSSLEKFQKGKSSVTDFMQNVQRQKDTANNLLDAYLGYRQALVDLQLRTYYDFGTHQNVFDRYKNLDN